MNRRIHLIGAPQNPLLQVVYIVVGGLLLIGAVITGAVILSFALAFALLAGLVIWVRIWWLRRKFLRHAGGGEFERQQRSTRDGAEAIEVEYTVVDERDDPRRRD